MHIHADLFNLLYIRVFFLGYVPTGKKKRRGMISEKKKIIPNHTDLPVHRKIRLKYQKQIPNLTTTMLEIVLTEKSQKKVG